MLNQSKGLAGEALWCVLLSPEKGMAIRMCIGKAFEQMIHEAVVS